MSVDHGTNSELQPLSHRRSDIVDSLRYSSAVQRCDSRKATGLDCEFPLHADGFPFRLKMAMPGLISCHYVMQKVVTIILVAQQVL
ncbi:hypothetical protein TNCV_4744251 [Trichonephila clavipes]|nr:hypothetical protein TNCV_4744251 [Trichonephila clavipes]